MWGWGRGGVSVISCISEQNRTLHPESVYALKVPVCASALQLLAHSRVEDVECYMQEIGHHMHVTLGASAATFTAEGTLVSKA